MSPSDSKAAAAAAKREWYRTRVRAGWPQVQVQRVEVVPYAFGHRARAVIQLGDLSPMEVRVELVPASIRYSLVPAGEADPRMWSTHSHENGCYVFERSISVDGHDACREWMVCVRPMENLLLPPVRRRFSADVGAG